MAIINGRRIDLSSIGNGVYGKELVPHANASAGRRPILETGDKVQQIDPNKFYAVQELKDKRGRGAKISSMPDRSKGSFGGIRSPLSKQIIWEQVADAAEHMFKQNLEFDENNARWLIIPNYRLPERWHKIARTTALMVVFPDEYPALPPIGFYMKGDIPTSPNGHFYQSTYHDAWQEPISQGWKWYCVYIHNGAWKPASNWRYGDNLYTYFHLINEALGSEG